MLSASELREKTEDELLTELTQLKRESYLLRFRMAGHEFKNTARVRDVRRQTARVLTIINEKKAQNTDAADKKEK